MTNYRLVFAVTGILLLLSAGGSTYAHHANASYDMTNSATIKGSVTGYDWTNPHAYIYLDVKNPKGAVEKWSAEMGSIGMLARAGWRRDTVKPGDEITIVGNRAKDGRPLLRLNKLVFANGQELTPNVQ